MLRLLQWLLVGCSHKWAVERDAQLRDKDGAYGRVIYFQCEKCGTIKRKTYS